MTTEMHANNAEQSRDSSAEPVEKVGSPSKRRLLDAYRRARPRLEAYALSLREVWGRRGTIVGQLLGRARQADKTEPAVSKLPTQASNDN